MGKQHLVLGASAIICFGIGPEGEVPVERYFLPIALGRGFGADLAILRPTTELAPRTRYRREYEYEPSPGEIETDRIEFETGAGPALGVPPLPQLLSTTAFTAEDA